MAEAKAEDTFSGHLRRAVHATIAVEPRRPERAAPGKETPWTAPVAPVASQVSSNRPSNWSNSCHTQHPC